MCDGQGAIGLDCQTQKTELEEFIKRKCPEESNSGIDITSANSPGQKALPKETFQQWKNQNGLGSMQATNSGIPYQVLQVLRFWGMSTNPAVYEATCRRFGQLRHKQKMCIEKESYILCGDRDASGKNFA